MYLIGFSLIALIGCYRYSLSPHQYIDDDRPSLTPKIFAEGYISTADGAEFGSVFSKDYKEFYYAIDLGGRAEIRSCQVNKGKWTMPATIIADTTYSYNDPMLSPDETTLYYISDMPRDAQDTIPDYDIWYSQKVAAGWSAPINAGMNINTDRNEFYISFTESGTMYFASNRDKEMNRTHDLDIYKAEQVDGIYLSPQKQSDAINTRGYEGDVFIAPDESYIIFSSARRTGLGRADLYVSFKNEDGQWSDAVIMGEPISSANHEICPFVTRDGKYFFYTRNQDIYWVSADLIHNFNLNR